jgi:hypothetical protein
LKPIRYPSLINDQEIETIILKVSLFALIVVKKDIMLTGVKVSLKNDLKISALSKCVTVKLLTSIQLLKDKKSLMITDLNIQQLIPRPR